MTSKLFAGFILAAIFATQNVDFVPAQNPIVRQEVKNEAWWANYAAFEVLRQPPSQDTSHLPRESWKAKGLEYELPDGRRVDIYNGIAWEVDWVKKWPESIGQSLGYGIATDSDSGIILLMENGEDEYYNAALSVVTSLRKHGYKFSFIVINVNNGKVWRH